MSRKRGRVELSEYAQMAERVVRAYGRRFEEEGDEQELLDLVNLGKSVEVAITFAVAELQRRSPTMSWAQIGRIVGMSAEGARQRWKSEWYPNGPVIYGLRARGDDRVRYVGQTCRLGMRVGAYRRAITTRGGVSQPLVAWLVGEGKDFDVVILQACASEQDLDMAEREWIEKLSDNLLNVRPGGRRRVA